MRFPLFMARRLYGQNDSVGRHVSRPAILIAIAGIAVGVAIMVLSVSIIVGFKSTVQSKVMGMGSHIQVMNYESVNSVQPQPITVPQEWIDDMQLQPGIRHVQPFVSAAGMLKTNDTFRGVLVRGMDERFDTTFLQQSLVEGRLPLFSSQERSHSIVLSRTQSNLLRLGVGDSVYAYFYDGKKMRAEHFRIVGIYATYMSEFDDKLAFTDLKTTRSLSRFQEDDYSGLQLEVDDTEHLEEISDRFAMRYNGLRDVQNRILYSLNIKQMYPGLFAWLGVLDTNVLVILILMICVASFTMISGLLIIILERTNFIGVMKAMGSTNSQVRRIFLHFAAMIVLKGILWGNAVGLGIVLLQTHFGIIRINPDLYYSPTVPMGLNWLYVLGISTGTLLISMLVLIVPSFIISRIRPAQSIRFE